MCDKHDPHVADVGPGGDGVCLMSWQDPQVPMPPEGYGKFDLNVHSNACFTASGPTKLTGYLEMTDAQGDTATNPVFEFDGCFDPKGDSTPTGHQFPSLLYVTSTVVTPTPDGTVTLGLGCGTGAEGCVGSVTATAGKVGLGTVPVDMREEDRTTLEFPTPLPAGATQVEFRLHHEDGSRSQLTGGPAGPALGSGGGAHPCRRGRRPAPGPPGPDAGRGRLEVDQAADGRTGLGSALAGGYDVVLLDVLLPGLDGTTVCRRLRAAGSRSRC